MKKILLLLLLLLVLVFGLKDKVYTNNTIILGSSLPKTGIIKEWGTSVNAGANAYFKYANDMDLIQGRKIKLLSYDDKYEPELTEKNIKKLIFKDKVFALFGFVGTPTVHHF